MKNYNRQISSITNRKWEKYSNETNVKYIKRKLKEYGINIPKYLQQGKLSTKQIQSNVNKIVHKVNKIKNEEIKKQDKFNKAMNKLKAKIGEYNKQTRTTLAMFNYSSIINQAKYNTSSKYLQGESVQLTSHLITNADQNAPLKEMGKNGIICKDINTINEQIERLDRKIENIKNIDFTKGNKEFEKMFIDFLNIYNEKDYLDDNTINNLIRKFKNMDYAQQSFTLDTVVGFAKERYRIDDDVDYNEDLTQGLKNYLEDTIKDVIERWN
ncbi:MAG: hypothetical protein ACI31M_04485 [Bacilli bacterium]